MKVTTGGYYTHGVKHSINFFQGYASAAPPDARYGGAPPAAGYGGADHYGYKAPGTHIFS